MKNLDLYWMTNDEWWEFKGYEMVVRDDAPLEAKESYKRYLEQLRTAKEGQI